MKTTSNGTLLAVIMACVLVVTSANALEFGSEVRASIGYSDNIARVPQDEIDQTLTTVGFDFDVMERTRKMDVSLRSRFDYNNYTDDVFDDEVVGGLDGLATFTLIEERLRWMIQDNYGQQLSDPFRPERPDNRENVNFFTTGPTLELLPSGRNLIRVEALYSRVDYEVRPADNDRLEGMLTIGRYVRRDSLLSLNLAKQRVEFDDSGLAPSIDIQSFFIRYEVTGSQNTLGIDLGYDDVEYAGNDADGILLRVDWTRTTSANGLLSISGGSQYSDQGDVYRILQDTTPDLRRAADVSATDAPFVRNFLIASYALVQERYSVNIFAELNQEDYKDDLGLDRDVYRGSVAFRRDITRSVFAGANAYFVRREFKYRGLEDDDVILGLEVGYRITPGFSVSLEYQNMQRNSRDIGSDFTENRVFLRASYIPRWSR